jgi:hypothetical protein
MGARAALILGLAAVALATALTLGRSPLRVVAVGAKSEESLGTTTESATVCQPGETLPAGVSAIRIGLEASFGPKVIVRVYSGSRVITAGSRAADWTSSSVTVPVKPLEHAVSPVKVCLEAPANSEYLQLHGAHASAGKAATGRAGETLSGRLSIAYLAPGGGSWWSRASSVATHMGFGHAIGGIWVLLLVAVLAGGAFAVLIALAWRELL